MVRISRLLCQTVPDLRQFACALVALVLVYGTPRASRACTYAFESRYVGSPSDGDIDVPTDVVLTVEGIALWPDQRDLANIDAVLSSDDGAELALSVARPYVWSYTWTPERRLQPNTSYRFTLSDPEGDPVSIGFTTGAGPLDDELPPPPPAFLQHYQLVNGPLSSCSPWQSGTCVAVPDDLWVQARSIDEFGQLGEPYLHRGAYLGNLSGIEQGTSDRCVELRSRASNGALSDAVTLCGDSAPLFDFDDEASVECTSAGFPDAEALEPHTEGGGASMSNPGCATAAKINSGGNWFSWLPLLVVASARHRRSKRPADYSAPPPRD